MAIEDAETLALVLGKVGNGWSTEEAPRIWQNWRKQRITEVSRYVEGVVKSRTATQSSDGAKPKDALGDVESLVWLYNYKVKEDLTSWMRAWTKDGRLG